MQDAALRMTTLTSQIGSTIGAILEFDAPGNQFGYPGRAGLDDVLDGIQIAKAVAGRHGILHVALKIVGLVGDASDAALGPVRVRFRTRLLGHDGDGMSALSQVERKTQPADAAANDDCLEMGRH